MWPLRRAAAAAARSSLSNCLLRRESERTSLGSEDTATSNRRTWAMTSKDATWWPLCEASCCRRLWAVLGGLPVLLVCLQLGAELGLQGCSSCCCWSACGCGCSSCTMCILLCPCKNLREPSAAVGGGNGGKQRRTGGTGGVSTRQMSLRCWMHERNLKVI